MKKLKKTWQEQEECGPRCFPMATKWTTRYWHCMEAVIMPGSITDLQSIKKQLTIHFLLLNCIPIFLVINPNPILYWEWNCEKCSFSLTKWTQLVHYHNPLMSNLVFIHTSINHPYFLSNIMWLSLIQPKTHQSSPQKRIQSSFIASMWCLYLYFKYWYIWSTTTNTSYFQQ